MIATTWLAAQQAPVEGEGSLSANVYSAEQLADLRAQGRPVFVNYTAAWCVTCLANEQVAFTSEKVQSWFRDNDITYLKADWTRRDDSITQELAEYGRSGVPLYLYFPSAGRAPVILPQILTPAIVLDALEAAERNSG